MLAQQLQGLEADGLLHRTVYPVVPPKMEYELTEEGRRLLPVLTAMQQWGLTYKEGEDEIACREWSGDRNAACRPLRRDGVRVSIPMSRRWQSGPMIQGCDRMGRTVRSRCRSVGEAR
jgi:DNA-binding PadR family transcriptional regulator